MIIIIVINFSPSSNVFCFRLLVDICLFSPPPYFVFEIFFWWFVFFHEAFVIFHTAVERTVLFVMHATNENGNVTFEFQNA